MNCNEIWCGIKYQHQYWQLLNLYRNIHIYLYIAFTYLHTYSIFIHKSIAFYIHINTFTSMNFIRFSISFFIFYSLCLSWQNNFGKNLKQRHGLFVAAAVHIMFICCCFIFECSCSISDMLLDAFLVLAYFVLSC